MNNIHDTGMTEYNKKLLNSINKNNYTDNV